MGDEHQDEGEPEDIHPVVLMVQPGDGNLEADVQDDDEDDEEDENIVAIPLVEDDLGKNIHLVAWYCKSKTKLYRAIFWNTMVCNNRSTIEASPIWELTAPY